MVMKKSFLVIILTLALSLPTFAFSAQVVKEGSIQGFMRFCEGQYTCSPQEEFIVAALEDIFILLDDEGNGYLLPNIKRSLLRQVLNKQVRIAGDTRLDGKAIMVSKAEVYRNGKWTIFYTPELAEKAYRDLRTPRP
jgi:hypothetical protein